MTLDRETILAADDLRREEVEVPEWGGSVYVRMLTATEKTVFSGGLPDDDDVPDDLLAQLAALTLCDDAGERLFDSDGDVAALGKKGFEPLERICEVAQRLNGVTAKAVETAAKNSESGQ